MSDLSQRHEKLSKRVDDLENLVVKLKHFIENHIDVPKVPISSLSEIQTDWIEISNMTSDIEFR